MEDVLVIGIDFGTTYSGVTWATSADFESGRVNLIRNWPGTGREESKAPTELDYEDGEFQGWGYKIPADGDPIRWFKLLLLKDGDLDDDVRQSEFLIRGRKMLKETGMTAVDLIAEYLKHLWQHILETIQISVRKLVLDALAFHVVITVPAIWQGYARKGMEEAATKAGILSKRLAGTTTLAFAPEPEAAALATLHERESELRLGEVYLVCDAGGGTVDLICYQVGGVDPTELHEAVGGTGGLCGGIFIDEAFENRCKSRLGRRWNKLTTTGVREIMKEEWEYNIKPQFTTNDPNKEYIVAIPAEAFKGQEASLNDTSKKPIIKNGRIHFSCSDLQRAFDGPFGEIERLINDQIAKAKEQDLSVTGIILVGGLGSSPYLYKYLHNRYGKKIEILRRSAISRGACMKGFLDGPRGSASNHTPNIMSTISRRSLGILYWTPFKEGVHQEEDKVWDPKEGIYKADNQMSWYLRKGENVSKKAPVRKDWHHRFEDASEFGSAFTMDIYQCDDDTQPTRLTSRVTKLCTITYNRDPSVTFESLETYYGGGVEKRKLKKFEFCLEMIPSGASTEFAAHYGGKKLKAGSANVQVEF